MVRSGSTRHAAAANGAHQPRCDAFDGSVMTDKEVRGRCCGVTQCAEAHTQLCGATVSLIFRQHVGPLPSSSSSSKQQAAANSSKQQQAAASSSKSSKQQQASHITDQV